MDNEDILRTHLRAILYAANTHKPRPPALAAIRRNAEAALRVLGPKPEVTRFVISDELLDGMRTEIEARRAELMRKALRMLDGGKDSD